MWHPWMRLLHYLKNCLLLQTSDEISDDKFDLLEFFVVRLYSKTCNTKQVSKARRILFSRDNQVIKNIPSTKKALRQHVLRSVLQFSKWRQSLCKLWWSGCLLMGLTQSRERNYTVMDWIAAGVKHMQRTC